MLLNSFPATKTIALKFSALVLHNLNQAGAMQVWEVTANLFNSQLQAGRNVVCSSASFLRGQISVYQDDVLQVVQYLETVTACKATGTLCSLLTGSRVIAPSVGTGELWTVLPDDSEVDGGHAASGNLARNDMTICASFNVSEFGQPQQTFSFWPM